MGSLCFVRDLYSHSETAQGKSQWIHQKEQKNYPLRFPNQVVGLSHGLPNHKSSLTNRVDEKSRSGNRNTCWAHFCGVALKLRQGTYQIQYTWHQTWLTFEVNSGYILQVFALHTITSISDYSKVLFMLFGLKLMYSLVNIHKQYNFYYSIQIFKSSLILPVGCLTEIISYKVVIFQILSQWNLYDHSVIY